MLYATSEVTSLQLQLDRCRTELSHYTTRLAHQLKIRCQADQEEYRRSLDGKFPAHDKLLGKGQRSSEKSLVSPHASLSSQLILQHEVTATTRVFWSL
eukprot:Em0013g352a